MSKYTSGVDFGTESGRALLVDLADGREVVTCVHAYANGVIDERLPRDAGGVRLEPDRALQDPNDYLEVFKHAVAAGKAAGGYDTILGATQAMASFRAELLILKEAYSAGV